MEAVNNMIGKYVIARGNRSGIFAGTFSFGEPWSKRTCLWLRGLPLLVPTNICKNHEPWVNTKGHPGHSGRDPKIRAKTFRGIAKAMAEQWG
jgi:hypothetical protein